MLCSNRQHVQIYSDNDLVILDLRFLAFSFRWSLALMALGSCRFTSKKATSCSASAMELSCRPCACSSGLPRSASSARLASLMAFSRAPVSCRLMAVRRRVSTSSMIGFSLAASRSLALSSSSASTGGIQRSLESVRESPKAAHLGSIRHWNLPKTMKNNQKPPKKTNP